MASSPSITLRGEVIPHLESLLGSFPQDFLPGPLQALHSQLRELRDKAYSMQVSYFNDYILICVLTDLRLKKKALLLSVWEETSPNSCRQACPSIAARPWSHRPRCGIRRLSLNSPVLVTSIHGNLDGIAHLTCIPSTTLIRNTQPQPPRRARELPQVVLPPTFIQSPYHRPLKYHLSHPPTTHIQNGVGARSFSAHGSISAQRHRGSTAGCRRVRWRWTQVPLESTKCQPFEVLQQQSYSASGLASGWEWE